MADHHGKKGAKDDEQKPIANALARVVAEGGHGLVRVGGWAHRSGLERILGYGDNGMRRGCYKTKAGSACRARQVAQAPAHASRHSERL